MSPAARFSCAALLLAACLPKFEIVDSFEGNDGGVTGAASGATSGTPATGSGGDSVVSGSSGTAGSGGASGSGDTGGASGASTIAGAGGSTAGAGGSTAGAGGNAGGAMGGAGGSGGTGAGASGRSGSSGAAGNGGSSGGAGGSKSGTGGTAGASGGNGGSAGGQGGASGSAGNGGIGGSGTGGTSVCGGGTVGPWADWPMPNAVTGGLPNPQSYDTSSTGVVRDNVTGLYWQRTVDTGRFTWPQAATYCATLTLGGCTGWRVPTRIELISIVDYSRTAPAIDGNAFPNTFQEPFWTSTPSPKSTGVDEARYINFTKGDVVSFDQRGALRVRCVR